jgi:CDP-glucose 4,6-dehydratase
MDQRARAVEDLVIDPAFWTGKRVFLTGHTGFKGAWLALLLRRLGSDVFGYALAPESEHDLFVVADVAQDVQDTLGDIRDLAALTKAIRQSQPDIVIHMAAQPLVQRSYREPVETYSTNVMGTVHLLEAVRQVPSVRAVVIVTSDKCYENRGLPHGYKETDVLDGHDPYSNSKSCAELVTASYRRSFFKHEGAARIASARSGNVIGGGDWAADRLVPDAARAFGTGRLLLLRNPTAVRPWQHVLDPLLGYLVLAERLAVGGEAFAEGWNFGPLAGEIKVEQIADRLVRLWGENAQRKADSGQHPHEAALLTLDCTKAVDRLGWRPRIDLDQGLRLTVNWYKAFYRGMDMRKTSLAQIDAVLSRAVRAGRSATQDLRGVTQLRKA